MIFIYLLAMFFLVNPLGGRTHIVNLGPEAFEPGNLTINQGDGVIFKNITREDHWPASNIHPTHGIYPEFDPQAPIPPGKSWEFRFDKAGSFTYHDHLFPALTGVITVKPLSQDRFLGFKMPDFLESYKGLLKNWEIDNYYDSSVSQSSKQIFANDRQLYSYVKKFGPKQTMTQLNNLSSEFGDCHESAHKAGRFAYQVYGSEAFKQCSAQCHSGCYHGATESYFKEHGTENLTEDLNILCSSELNSFFSHQCLHGIGHGLMAWSNYDLKIALKNCELLSKGQESCFTGVFMENIIGGLADTKDHFSWYLNDDPHFPCSIVEQKYKSSCYFLQTSRMVQLFSGDFNKVAQSCAQAPEAYRDVCFESMGRDVGGVSRGKPQKAIELCSSASDDNHRKKCLNGAVQDSFWDPSGQDEAIAFCKLLSNDEKQSCYQILFLRNTEVIHDKQSQKAFCQKAEIDYVENCLSYID